MVDTTSLDRFLATALRQSSSGRDTQWRGIADPEWDTDKAISETWKRIEYHGIAHILHQNASMFATWPDVLRKRIASEARLMTLWETTHAAVLSNFIEALDLREIDHVFTKGTALAYSVYEDPAHRRRSDSDILVEPTDLDATRETLSSLGWYRKDDPHGLYCQESWLFDVAGEIVHMIDLHWEATDRPALQEILGNERFFGGKLPLERLHPDAWQSDPIATLMHCVVNQKWHQTHGYWTSEEQVAGARRLIWSMDFALLAQSLRPEDWKRLLAFCAETRSGPLVAEALRGAQADLDAKFPEGLLETLEEGPLNASLELSLTAADSLDLFWQDVSSARSLARSLSLIRNRAMPPRDHLVGKYPSATRWPTLALQVRHWFETAFRVARKVANSRGRGAAPE